MKQLFLGGGTLVVHLYLFLAFGSLFLKILKREEKFSWCFVPVLGMFVYYSCFELLALPMTLLLVPLHILTAVWGILMGIAGIAGAVISGKLWVQKGKSLGALVGQHRLLFVCLILLTGVQLFYGAAYYSNSADAAFYVGNVSTSLYTDTLGRYSPYTGKALSTFNVRYVTAAYYLENAVFCSLFHVHPMVLVKTITPVLVFFLANLLYYHLGMSLFWGNRKKAAGFTALVFFFGLMAGAPDFSGFLFYRTFEGKALLYALSLPCLFLLFLELYRKPEERFFWWGIFAVSLGSVCLTTSSMTVIPAAVGAAVLAMMILKKTIRPLLPAMLGILPDLCLLAFYLAVKLHYLNLPAK
jgi:hypothetical protein